jgi:hypothetical protein
MCTPVANTNPILDFGIDKSTLSYCGRDLQPMHAGASCKSGRTAGRR